MVCNLKKKIKIVIFFGKEKKFRWTRGELNPGPLPC
jgi:hypothetical protein